MLKKLWRLLAPNPLDRLLRKSQKKGDKRFLIPWNRGLGDIALGLFAIVQRIRSFVPEAEITFMIRKDLEEGFKLMPGVQAIVMPSWERGRPYTLPKDLSSYDCIIHDADPSYWVKWQRGALTPKLTWDPAFDKLYERFELPAGCLGVHVNAETNYYNERNWPAKQFDALFSQVKLPILLFGLRNDPPFEHKNVIDLRGKLTLLETLSIIKGRCRALIAPDSGILSMVYYLNTPFPLHVVSLWADPNHGILKQGVASPNPLLAHTPVISPNRKNAALISVPEVLYALALR